MRVAAISDIHGNLPALEAVLAEIDGAGIDRIVVAGDTVSGPWAAEVFDVLEQRDAVVVRGNADREVVERSDRFGPLASWSADRLGARRLASAGAWPLTASTTVDGLGRVLVCHATPTSDDPVYTRLTPEDALLDLLGLVTSDVVVCGHTHMQFDRTLANGLRVVNVGSVGLPYEGSRGAYWAVLGPDVDLRRTEYDVEACVAAMETMGAPVPERTLDQLLDPADPAAVAEHFESLRGT